ncbi:MAG: hypothetical protein ACLSHU_00810 [Oscillospiraceae bacterium]|jgi:hypothetical protein
MDSKWAEIRNLCLELALAELKKETAATVGTVRELVKIAIEIDMLNLQRSVQSRYGAAVKRGAHNETT